MSTVHPELSLPIRAWRFTATTWFALVAVLCVVFITFRSGLLVMFGAWGDQGEYSYGYLIPFIAFFLAWQKKDQLEILMLSGSWWGLAVVLLGISLYAVGELATLYSIVEYSFIIVLIGIILSLVGWRGLKLLIAPLVILFFMIPLPEFIFQGLALRAQLISSQLGVAVIQLFGISVYLEGNVIDLGTYKLQVAEACNGLRYLFPLMIVGFIMSYFFKVAMWKRLMVFLSTIPITILMNSLRIGVIGIAVQYWGTGAAEGVLHDFEGWLVFMFCTGMLAAEMWLLTRLSQDKRPLRMVFGLELPRPTPRGAKIEFRRFPRPFLAAVAPVAVGLFLSLIIPTRAEMIPGRQSFAAFPMTIAGWSGEPQRMSQLYIDALKFDDYVLADYRDAAHNPVNLYVAYYDSQRKGVSAHSPRSCIPGGGWQINSLTQKTVDGVKVGGVPLSVNRAVIQKGENTQLVYYWFQQRGRVITNEYLVKWYLFWDALTKNRTDGALVRVTTSIAGNTPVSQADTALMQFVSDVAPRLIAYIPG